MKGVDISLMSALHGGVSGQLHAPADLLPGKQNPVPTGQTGWGPGARLDVMKTKNSYPYRESNP
jgi:hypothetical protein